MTPRLPVSQLFDRPKIIAAKEFDGSAQRLPGQSVWLGAQMALLVGAPWYDAGPADVADDDPMHRIVGIHGERAAQGGPPAGLEAAWGGRVEGKWFFAEKPVGAAESATGRARANGFFAEKPARHRR